MNLYSILKRGGLDEIKNILDKFWVFKNNKRLLWYEWTWILFTEVGRNLPNSLENRMKVKK